MAEFLDEVERCIPSLRRYARALERDHDRADDLVQDTLERALSRRALFRRGGNMRGWLLTILHNLHVNELRRRAVRSGTVPLEAAGAALSAPAPQPGRMVVRDLQQALLQLGDDHRQVLLLVALEGMAYREVAEVLGVPLGTVMSRLARARERLRQLMDGTETPPLRRVK
jgi:RNA polymerase sigma-70 factor, ECF subfamily